jgi:hypothetical protein
MWLNNYRARPVEPITSPKIRHLAGIGLENPSQLTTQQIRELSASVMAHIEPRQAAGQGSRNLLGIRSANYRARPVEPITSLKIRHWAGIGLENPSQLTTQQIRELSASVMAHIEPRQAAGREAPNRAGADVIRT